MLHYLLNHIKDQLTDCIIFLNMGIFEKAKFENLHLKTKIFFSNEIKTAIFLFFSNGQLGGGGEGRLTEISLSLRG